MTYQIITLGEVTSTNDVAMHSGDYAHGTIITARRQTAGRGQRGNRWENPQTEGDNLLFSLILEPTHIRAEHQFQISMMAALAASDAVHCSVKWPNDLYIGDRKVGGILIEHTLQGEFLTRSVIGIGINVGQRVFDPGLPNPTSIALESPTSSTPMPEEVLRGFCDAFTLRYSQSSAELQADYRTRLWRGEGKYHPYKDIESGETFEAIIHSVNAHTGELSLVDTTKKARNYWFKEVEAIL
jgi:BirA family biotin operon repressor/biotin-[acetyl-CoA-carboxylase] ligase